MTVDCTQEDNGDATGPVDEGHMATIQGSGGYEHLWSDVEPPEHEVEHSFPDPERYELQGLYGSSGQVVTEEHMHS